MIIISHRGLWKKEKEKNTEVAFRESLSHGFGIETDIRANNGKLVISHDIANDECMTFENFLAIYKSYNHELPLALNIKEDGLCEELEDILDIFKISNYFVFDMSIPDTIGYMVKKLNFYSRQSEYEIVPAFYDKADGVWMDEFHEHWIEKRNIIEHIEKSKKICIVSPELHGRNFLREWEEYRDIERELNSFNLMICTDHPTRAKEFFDE
jgi:hypothetical protein